MLENCKTAQERWGGTHEMIDRWLADRRETLVTFFDIQGKEGEEDVSSSLKAFCERLMDYLSEGHFEIYEQLFREAKEFDDGGLALANEIYPKIDATTQIMLDFNDKYDTDAHIHENLTDLHEDLSRLGEKLSERFDFEDQLIEKLHNVHKNAVA
ncbi:sigma D regulator [Reinekea marina]|uniref:Sigma D regulator n=1 Tax=Reinekea marina TaxID=1310421 RepID=A0ABV7WPB6_9GAMM|nr:sigma D regulator [Reinekea marina]MBU2864538.1 sigma D regulator [Reinekea forsetii]MDN3647724.1 sigma D regulator [Reinekea marina]